MSTNLTTQLSGSDYDVLQIVGKLNDLSITGNVQAGSTGNSIFGGGTSTQTITSSSLDAAQFCQQYQTYRPLLVALLPSVRGLAVYGKPLAAAIEVVTGIADAYCGTGN